MYNCTKINTTLFIYQRIGRDRDRKASTLKIGLANFRRQGSGLRKRIQKDRARDRVQILYLDVNL